MMDNLNPVNSSVSEAILQAEEHIASQKLVIERLSASRLDVSWAEINLREMNEHLELVQKNLDTLGTINRNAVI
jgi:hypothetical protein